jgi:hypothetical protein
MSAALPANLTAREQAEVQCTMSQGLSLGGAVDALRRRQAVEADRARRAGTAPLAADVLAEVAELRTRDPQAPTGALVKEVRGRRLTRLRALDPNISPSEAEAFIDEQWFETPPPLPEDEQRRRGRLKAILTPYLKRAPDLTLAQARKHLQEVQMQHGDLMSVSAVVLMCCMEEVRQQLTRETKRKVAP